MLFCNAVGINRLVHSNCLLMGMPMRMGLSGGGSLNHYQNEQRNSFSYSLRD